MTARDPHGDRRRADPIPAWSNNRGIQYWAQAARAVGTGGRKIRSISSTRNIRRHYFPGPLFIPIPRSKAPSTPYRSLTRYILPRKPPSALTTPSNLRKRKNCPRSIYGSNTTPASRQRALSSFLPPRQGEATKASPVSPLAAWAAQKYRPASESDVESTPNPPIHPSVRPSTSTPATLWMQDSGTACQRKKYSRISASVGSARA